MFRRLLCLFVLLLAPQFGQAQVGHVNDPDAVLYARGWDIFACDPASGKTVNLTQRRVGWEGGWNQPWEPVGDLYKVVFRQWRGTGENTESRIFVLEAIGSTTIIRQIPEIFAFAVSFSWSNVNTSFAFVNDYRSVTPHTEIIIIENETVKARIPTAFSKCNAKWSPDGKWIAVISRVDKGLLLISTEDYSQIPIPLSAGSVSDRLAWGPDSRRLALVLNGILSIIDLEGNVLQAFGAASSVDDWSADGRYISYVSTASGTRQSIVLFLGGSEEVISGYEDENCGIWSPDGTILAFWAIKTGDYLYSLTLVGPDGKNPRVIGSSSSAGYMPPSWFKLPKGMLEAFGQ